jgi:hypothetical protein
VCKLAAPEGLVVARANPEGMTTEHEATRTLVKSPPELWAECSDAASLARHLGEFGEIKITRLEPETTVAWEGERASGTVRIEPSGWGTRVTFTAETTDDAAEEPVAVEQAPVVTEQSLIREVPAVEEVPAYERSPVGVERPVVQEPPVVDEPRVDEQAVLAEDVTPVPQVEVAPKVGVMARLRAFFRPKRAAETAEVAEPREPEPLPAPAAKPEPQAESLTAEVDPEPVSAAEPEPLAAPAAEPEARAADPHAVLAAALDSLGQAHHRPFSRG